MDNQTTPTSTPATSSPVTPIATPQTHSQKGLLIILGILEIPFSAFGLYLLFPLIKLQGTLGTIFVGPYLGLAFFVSALVVALIQIVTGLFSYDLKLGKQKTKILIILGLILAALTIPVIILTVIMPIYGNIETLK